MKNRIILLALLSFTTFSCEKENSVINQLEGKWNVSELQFSGNAQSLNTQKDSVAKVTETSIEFAVCNARNNSGGGDTRCRVYITENAKRYELVYQVDADKQRGNMVSFYPFGESAIISSPAYQRILKKWDGIYQIIESSRKNLVIVREYDCTQINSINYCNKMRVIASR
ncbi:MAG: hypothetical protein EAZ32_03455 [Cytophagia bacterium]|nr:MAG: hypothetical protein EAZ46_02350 [Runella sp.]TAG41286.1 MAG: hypothetical protein EAZ32_03455 [Cytophagia bacterium]